MRHIVTSFVTPLVPPHFSTLSHKGRDSQKDVAGHKMRIFIYSATFA
jgi:hypothetical protein